jgi:hypothetical protein
VRAVMCVMSQSESDDECCARFFFAFSEETPT